MNNNIYKLGNIKCVYICLKKINISYSPINSMEDNQYLIITNIDREQTCVGDDVAAFPAAN